MTTQADIASQFKAALAVSMPELDTSVGTPMAKILDALAAPVADAYVDNQLQTYVYDIDSKTDADLDSFCQLFGIARLPAKRASGTVTFTRGTDNTDATVFIPINLQITSSTDTGVIFQTITGATMDVGVLSITVPVQAVQAGPSGNIGPSLINNLSSPIQGVASVINVAATSGGLDQETDSALRARWKATVFRNMAGTECQPPGTRVLVPRGARHVPGVQGARKVELEWVPIESLAVGDRVASWRRGVLLREGREITGITSTEYSGPLVVVQDEGGRTSRYTPNHRCIAKMGPALEGKHLVYLQRRGIAFRIGTTTDRRANSAGDVCNSSGLADRLGAQQADEAWVLSVHNSSEDALLAEAYASWHFGIPMTLFQASKRQGPKVQERLDMFWNKVGDLVSRASACLSHHGRMIEHPLIRRNTKKTWSRASEIEACNLIDGCELIDAEATIRSGSTEHIPIKVTTEFYEGPVWSMDVDEFHTYVADGFVTHNSMFLGIALNDPDCFAANVVTATKQVREQLQVASGTATSTVNDAKYVFGTPVSFGTDLDNGVVFIAGHDYTFNATIPPTITVNNSGAIPDGTIAEAEYQYTPAASRSDPSTGIVNRIDVWCAGSRAVSAQQSMVFKNSKLFASSGTYNLNNFVHTDGTHPTLNNVFIPLAFGPVLTVSPTILVGSTTYGHASTANPMGTVAGGVTYAYRIVHDNTAFGWTPSSMFGLEWNAANLPANNAVFTVGSDGAYTYNEVPSSVQGDIDSWRLAGTDAQAHQAQNVLLRFSLAVMYDRISYPPQVNQAMDAALSGWLNSLGINSVVQVSDVLQVLHNVPGVDNVRFLNGSDWPGWTSGTSNSYQVGIQQISSTGTVTTSYVDTSGRPHDVFFTDSQVPQFGASLYAQRAGNSFGSY